MIDAKEMVGLRLSSDGRCLQMRVRDQLGQTITISLPACWMNTMLNALPGSSGPDTIHSIDSWSLDRIGSGRDLVLTLRTPEGQATSFSMKPWQIEGMATIATFGTSGQAPYRTIH